MIPLTRRTLTAVLAGTVAALPATAMGEERVALDGLWTGELGAGAEKVQLTFQIDANGAGTLRVLDSGGASTVAARVTSTALSHVIIEASAVNGRFEGAARVNGRLEGRWRQGWADLPLVLVRR